MAVATAVHAQGPHHLQDRRKPRARQGHEGRQTKTRQSTPTKKEVEAVTRAVAEETETKQTAIATQERREGARTRR
jgi:hypothetical protein